MSLVRPAVLVYSLFMLLLASCSSSENEQKKAPVPAQVPAPAVTPTDTPLDTAVYFSGVWVNELYVRKLTATKSPRASQDAAEVSCITIPRRTLQTTRFVYGFHDGRSDMEVVKKGDQYLLHPQTDDKTPLKSIELVTPDKMKVGKDVFIKVAPGKVAEQADLGILNSLLFQGAYTTDLGKTVTFTPDGQVQGLEHFTTYSPMIDYGDAGLDVDQLILSAPGKKEESFAFKFDKNTLLIYRLKCVEFDNVNKRCNVVDFGDLLYRLQKK